MRILTLHSTLRFLSANAFRDGNDRPVLQQQVKGNRDFFDFESVETDVFSPVIRTLQDSGMLPLDIIAVRGLYGGERFTEPVYLAPTSASLSPQPSSDPVLVELADLAPQSPLHVPHVIQLIEAARRAFPRTPIALAFETAFFVSLPERERRYGVDPELTDSRSLRRFGYHGIFHEAACLEAVRDLGSPHARVLSICLEPRPELAACRGRRPLMVTGGATPIEGLPGETSCGDLDPSVALKLADDECCGPERTGQLLACESGLKGLAGRDVSLSEVLLDVDSDLKLARDVFQHNLLRACGAGIAALGGLDAIVYSGRYADSAGVLHEWLNQRLRETLQRNTPGLFHEQTLAQQLRDIGYVLARENRPQVAV